jgi:hypothetical protein
MEKIGDPETIRTSDQALQGFGIGIQCGSAWMISMPIHTFDPRRLRQSDAGTEQIVCE